MADQRYVQLASSYRQQANAAYQAGDLDAAIGRLGNAIDAARPAVDLSSRRIDFLASLLDLHADWLEESSNLDESLEATAEALEKWKLVVASNPTAYNYHHLDCLRRYARRLASALRYRDAVVVSSEIVALRRGEREADPDSVSSKQRLAEALEDHADFLYYADQKRAAKSSCAEARKLRGEHDGRQSCSSPSSSDVRGSSSAGQRESCTVS